MAPEMRAAAPSAADPGRVRQLLDAVLPGDTELAAFCQDCFPQVRALFTAAMDRAQRVELLLARVADEREVEARLRAFAPNAMAWGPQRSAWPYVLLGLALVTALLGGFLAWRMTMARRPQGFVPAAAAGAGGPWARGRAATLVLLPGGAPWYGARHKEAPCCPPAPVPWRARARYFPLASGQAAG